jgi:hypothetical protein
MPAAAVLLCSQVEISLACHCNYTYGFFDLIQVFNNPAQMHSNNA